jgi:hypothetical protein
MAARQSAQREDGPLQRTVRAKRFQRVARTGGLETAGGRQHGGYAIAINLDRRAQNRDSGGARMLTPSRHAVHRFHRLASLFPAWRRPVCGPAPHARRRPPSQDRPLIARMDATTSRFVRSEHSHDRHAPKGEVSTRRRRAIAALPGFATRHRLPSCSPSPQTERRAPWFVFRARHKPPGQDPAPIASGRAVRAKTPPVS